MTAVVNSSAAGGTPSSRVSRKLSETPSTDSRIQQTNGVQVRVCINIVTFESLFITP